MGGRKAEATGPGRDRREGGSPQLGDRAEGRGGGGAARAARAARGEIRAQSRKECQGHQDWAGGGHRDRLRPDHDLAFLAESPMWSDWDEGPQKAPHPSPLRKACPLGSYPAVLAPPFHISASASQRWGLAPNSCPALKLRAQPWLWHPHQPKPSYLKCAPLRHPLGLSESGLLALVGDCSSDLLPLPRWSAG